MQALDATYLDDLVDRWFAPETQQLVAATVRRMTKPTPTAAVA
jgi:hypothetical protein